MGIPCSVPPFSLMPLPLNSSVKVALDWKSGVPPCTVLITRLFWAVGTLTPGTPAFGLGSPLFGLLHTTHKSHVLAHGTSGNRPLVRDRKWTVLRGGRRSRQVGGLSGHRTAGEGGACGVRRLRDRGVAVGTQGASALCEGVGVV